MRLVFMGTPDFAVLTLQRIHAAGHEVVYVLTQPDKPVGRRKVLTPSPVKEAAVALGLTVLQPTSVNARRVREQLQSAKPEAAVVLAFGQIFRRALLDLFPLGCINAHGSLLPKYRGAAPIQRAVMSGETQTGVTMMRMDEGLDTGPVLLTRTISIGPNETSGEVFASMAEVAADATVAAISLLEAGTAVFVPQSEGWTYAPKLTEQEASVDWSRPAIDIHNCVRGLNPAPGAATCLDGQLRLKLWRTRTPMPDLDSGPTQLSAGCDIRAGAVVAVLKESLVVQTGDGLLELLEVQPAGGKRMGAAEFARGRRVMPSVSRFGEGV